MLLLALLISIHIFETRADVQSNSGTMFRQILEKDDNVDYLVLGLSQGRNTRSLYEYVKKKELSMYMQMKF